MDLRIHGGVPLSGSVTVPADKSITHRALILAALANGTSRIDASAPGADNRSTAAVLAALGVQIERGEAGWEVSGRGAAGLAPPDEALDCGNSGTTARLLGGVLAGAGVRSRLIGDASLSRRPMARVAEPLRALGGRIEGRRDGDREVLPLEIAGPGFQGGRQTLTVASAQVKSALLLAGASSGKAVEVTEPVESRDHTERMLAAMGAQVGRRHEGSSHTVTLSAGTALQPVSVRVPGDFSSAAFLLAAGALIGGSSVAVRDVGVNSTRTGFLEILEELGADIQITDWREEGGEPICTLTVRPRRLVALRPGGVPTVVGGPVIPRLIDELVVLAAVAASADGPTEVRDARELRVKESDRIRETLRLLAAFGIAASERQDGFRIEGPQRPRPATVDVSADHRLALTAAVLALAADGESHLVGFDIAEVSFPGFADSIAALGGRITVA
jgi:3-phosphoshikimate 1-carboxyvinyltransferase